MPSAQDIHKAHQPNSGAGPKLELALKARAELGQAARLVAQANLRAGQQALQGAASVQVNAQAAALLNGLADVMGQALAKIRAEEEPSVALGLAGRYTWSGPNVGVQVAGNLLAQAKAALVATGSLEAKAALPILGGALKIAAKASAKGVTDVKVGLAVPLARQVAFSGSLDLGRGTGSVRVNAPGLQLDVSPTKGALSWRMGNLRLALVAGWGARRAG